MDVTNLTKHTRKELLALAKQHGIKGVSRLQKQALVDRLRQVLSPQPQPAPDPPISRSSPIPVEKQAQQIAAAPEFAPRLIEESLEEGSNASPSFLSTEHFEHAVTDSKFFLGPQPSLTTSEPDVLPASYNDNRIVLLARDPHWVHIYWDFNGERWTEAQNQRDAAADRLVLRVFDVTYIEFNGANAWSSTDVELTPFSTSWYVAVPRPDAAYCAEIGYRSPTGRFVSLGRSNIVTTPRVEASPITKVRWLTPPERRDAAAQNKDFSSPPVSAVTLAWDAAQASASQLPAPSSDERPFSWGAVHKQ